MKSPCKNLLHMLWLLAALLIMLGGCLPSLDLDDNASVCKLEATLLAHEDIIRVASISLPESSNLQSYDFVLYSIRYLSDGYEVMGYVAAPADFMEHKYPILIYNRSGNRNFGALTPYPIILASLRGYIVLASQYRGVAGGTGIEQFGGDDINDVIKLIDISESFVFVQQGGVYMFGGSRGGMMTYIACRKDDRIMAAAVWAGVSNVFHSFNERGADMQQALVELIGGTPSELPEEYERRSAVFWADEIDVPLLIGHGGVADWRVPTHHSVNMASALERYDKPHRLIIYPDAGHDIVMDFLDEIDDWFRLHPITN